MTDLKSAKAALDAKRREKSKIDAECEALERKIEAETARKEVGKKLEPAMAMLLANRSLRDELAKYSVRESRAILQELFSTPAIAEAFRAAATRAEPQLSKIKEKIERDRQRRAERKKEPADTAAAEQAAEQVTAEASEQAAEQASEQTVGQAVGQAAAQQAAEPAVKVVMPPVMPRSTAQAQPRIVPAPRMQ